MGCSGCSVSDFFLRRFFFGMTVIEEGGSGMFVDRDQDVVLTIDEDDDDDGTNVDHSYFFFVKFFFLF